MLALASQAFFLLFVGSLIHPCTGRTDTGLGPSCAASNKPVARSAGL